MNVYYTLFDVTHFAIINDLPTLPTSWLAYLLKQVHLSVIMQISDSYLRYGVYCKCLTIFLYCFTDVHYQLILSRVAYDKSGSSVGSDAGCQSRGCEFEPSSANILFDVAWKVCCVVYWCGKTRKRMRRWTGRRDMTEQLLKTALNPNESINQSSICWVSYQYFWSIYTVISESVVILTRHNHEWH